MIKAVNEFVVLKKVEQKRSEGGIYLSQKQEEAIQLGQVLSIQDESEIKTGMIVGYDPYDELKYSGSDEVIIVNKNKILFIWEGKE